MEGHPGDYIQTGNGKYHRKPSYRKVPKKFQYGVKQRDINFPDNDISPMDWQMKEERINKNMENTSRLEKLKELRRLRAIEYHLDFVHYMWNNPSEEYMIGQHTKMICSQIDEAIKRYKNGESVFKVIMVPFRHGKSEIISRKLPAHFLGLFPDGKVLLTGHTSDLTTGFSRESRDLIKEPKYERLFPGIILNQDFQSAAHWAIQGHQGECFAAGLQSGLAGQGYTLGIVDDYHRNRADAESPTNRNRTWDAFTNDFLTRRAPISITIVTATPWNVDDLIARIKREMKDNPSFPKFEFISMPAFSSDYKEGVLFPERFPKSWYEEQRAALGEYGAASLLQLNPTAKGGNIIKIDNIKKIPLKEFPDVTYTRVWDLAHTAKERASQDPDYTSGTQLYMRRKEGAWKQWELFIKDVKRFRMDAPQRDNNIVNITLSDGPYCRVAIEDTLDSKDAYKTLQKVLFGHRTVLPVRGKGDKVTRASALEPIFEAGNIYVPEDAPWLNDWIEELASFPSGAHDDQVDNLSAGYALFNTQSGVVETGLGGV